MDFMQFISIIIPLMLTSAAPIISSSIGGLFSERSGVFNIGLEGLMMVGAFTAATVTVLVESSLGPISPWIGMLAGIITGGLFSVIHAYVSINLRADQVISGTAINLLGAGLTIYLCEIIFNQQRTVAFMNGIKKDDIPVLSDIPLLGNLLFKKVHITSYMIILIAILVWYIVYKTPFGLRLRAVGEHPGAADSMGINVYKMRYIGVILSGMFAGLGGGIMVLTQDIQYTYATIHGTGFIALAALIFGKWHPLGVVGAGIFFGFSQALGIIAYQIPFLAELPQEFFWAFPYVLTVIALVAFSGKSVGPRAAGKPYEKGER
ncbi:ABC transporter permease [Paramaledivibacter caminithermalis]|jgi:simple sugar transport system permease protein|uniref:Nucleoside ABC transporter membrane protein n=1 Tax=Paramaledivibacter caminithermalis (strain DSM 15212 / CIP 107654 / DViRD3) TaxID=1121301 RepID=A0A1M6R5D2_PARC5|nr:ABC transporter permease [Paramaledivibacter caminithermalis]SHK27663.1 nucleoside ABC transporter membrane protein [Paramaledivibacter caminithermalis DSM 15212]